jgi:ectoine hydroxylase
MQTLQDVYESRTTDKPRLSERMEPVFYGGPDAPGPLTRAQREQYDRDGFLLFREFFPESAVEYFQEELARLGTLKALRRSPVAIRERNSGRLRSIFAVHRLSPVFRGLARAPRLLNLAEQILGGPVYIHQSRVNLKPGFDGKEFFWHSDFETWHVEDGMPRMRAFSCVISLTENTETNGPLMVIPGSHKHFIACVDARPMTTSRRPCRSRSTACPMRIPSPSWRPPGES